MIARAEAVLTVSQQLPRRFEQLLRNERSRGERTEEAGRSRKGKIWRDEDGDDIPAKKRPPLISHQGTDGRRVLSVFWHERIWKRARESDRASEHYARVLSERKTMNCLRELKSSPKCKLCKAHQLTVSLGFYYYLRNSNSP